MKSTDVYGIGNALVDIPFAVPLDVLNDLKFPPGLSQLVTPDEQAKLFDYLRDNGHHSGRKLSAGSVANSLFTIASLDKGTASFGARIGDDRFGHFYTSELTWQHVEFGNPLIVGGTTGTSIALVTPDGERTMRACLGCSAEFAPDDVSPNFVKAARWLFVEGYLFANGDSARDAIVRAVELAKQPHEKDRTSVALTLSDPSIVKTFRPEIEAIIDRVDLIFANRKEAMALTGETSAQAALEALKKMVPGAIVTAGKNGAYIFMNGREAHAPALPAIPIDTTGAGDVFAGGFLYGVTNGYSAEDAARGASHLASQVIQVYGPRLPSARVHWMNSQSNSASQTPGKP